MCQQQSSVSRLLPQQNPLQCSLNFVVRDTLVVCIGPFYFFVSHTNNEIHTDLQNESTQAMADILQPSFEINQR